MRASATSFALLAALAAVSSPSAHAQQCQAPSTECAGASSLMYCSSGTWATEACSANMGCMTMGAMVHCMLNADFQASTVMEGMTTSTSGSANPSSSGSASPTSSSHPTSSASNSKTSDHSSGASTFGIGAFVAVGAVIAGMVALF
ncbi:hypothetical protein GGI25_004537 [Coemansia spiralis]|uniref:Extracellular membrane protein CFEM domain-containing protein n=2 Tax=Coemansia TaxID=4863 RepID=A0A9W8G5G0_9FUNG|nr:hypothetical protein EDC05_004238 [Coemansia umbellata]KAJ2620707.1 hypothetical protein GGI26_004785 [Coemansia sp. RSA 1358]KAJ2673970.1 hypothetical protein GGI25_004537 [Coemansia spiralis]